MSNIFKERLNQCLKNNNIKQIELSRMSNISASSISDWMKGKYIPKQDKLYKIAECLNVDPHWLMGKCDDYKISKNKNSRSEDFSDVIDNIAKIPILGEICAGNGVYCEEIFDDFMYVDQNTRADFALRVKGDSMIEAGILHGDIVFIRKQSYVSNGKIAAVLLTDSNEASLKKFYRTSENIVLQPCNSEYEPIITRNVEVIGECVGVYREL